MASSCVSNEQDMIEKNKLLQAVLKRSVSQVQNCLVDGEDLYFQDDHARNYLHLSVFLRCNELVKHFLDEGLDVNHRDRDNVTALHRACRSGCEATVETLLAYGANIGAEANDSITPLHVAAAFGHTKCVKAICSKEKRLNSSSSNDHESSSLVDCRDARNHTPLHYAAAEGHVMAALVLIKEGCDVNAENTAGNRPLHFAATSGRPDLCKILLNHASRAAQIDAQNHNGQTALHLATQQACISTVIYLLEAKADPNIRDMQGNTCAHLAIKNGQIELLRTFMLDSRTDTSISNNEENTVLHVALKAGHFNLIPMMLPNARDLTRQDGSGCSVIIEAIKNQLEDLALEMLKTCPSLVHTATHDLVTPLHLAAERGMTNLTKQLLIAGAQVDAADSSGLTPSLYCAKNDSVLECLAMIEDIMMINDNSIDDEHNMKGNNSKVSSRISS